MINLRSITGASRAVLFSTLALGLVASTLDCPSWAGRFAQNHPRRAEVLRRDNSLGGQLNSDRGHLGGHYNQLAREDQGIHNQEQRDALINGGYITPGQQAQLNREENHMQGQMNRDYSGAAAPGSFAANHPRRSQVLREDNGLNNQLSADKGNLGGHYSQLQGEDNSIRHQEQRDASVNGGYITPGQQQHLDNEEQRLQNQISRDHN